MSQEQNKKRPMMGHGPGRGMMPGEKAKNFTGTIQKLSDCARRRNLICNRKYGI